MENWKKIKDFENYEISDYGNVKSFYFKKEKILKHKIDKDGYFGVCLVVNGKNYYKKIHRLVVQHFSNEIEKETVNHIDGNKKNNYIYNLEWNTRSENNKHAYSIGLKVQKAEYLKKKVLITKDDFIKEYDSLKEASIDLNLDENCLSKVCRGKHKTHNKYTARFI